ncbi:MAG: DUF86 domain-containing protein [Euryarchaeota archaeon]|nr:DUF86 domain-containing protein [Euryarchaeota archaeon]
MVSESTLRRIERFEEGVKLLREITKVSFDDYSKSLKLQSIAERNLQVCTEAIIDLSNVIISKMALKVPSAYKDTVRILRENKILENKLGKSIEDLIGIRNIIVHMYADVKAEIIHENLNEFIDTLERTLKSLLEFCKKNKIDP